MAIQRRKGDLIFGVYGSYQLEINQRAKFTHDYVITDSKAGSSDSDTNTINQKFAVARRKRDSV